MLNLAWVGAQQFQTNIVVTPQQLAKSIFYARGFLK